MKLQEKLDQEFVIQQKTDATKEIRELLKDKLDALKEAETGLLENAGRAKETAGAQETRGKTLWQRYVEYADAGLDAGYHASIVSAAITVALGAVDKGKQVLANYRTRITQYIATKARKDFDTIAKLANVELTVKAQDEGGNEIETERTPTMAEASKLFKAAERSSEEREFTEALEGLVSAIKKASKPQAANKKTGREKLYAVPFSTLVKIVRDMRKLVPHRTSEAPSALADAVADNAVEVAEAVNQ